MLVFVVCSSYTNPNGQGHNKRYLSYDVVSGSEITHCIEINKQLVVCRFSGNVMKLRFLCHAYGKFLTFS